MAISLVGVTEASGASQTIVVVKPSGASTNDRLYVLISHNNETITATDNNPSTPTTKQNEYPAPASGSGGFTIFYRTLGASEPASYGYTLTNSQRWVAIAWVLRGMASAAFDVVPGTVIHEVVAATTTCPSATTGVDHAWAFAVSAIDSTGSGVFTAGPAGWTELATENTQQPTSVYYKEISPAGASGSAAFTKTSSGNNDTYSMQVFSIAPSVGGGGTSWAGIYHATADVVPQLMARGVTRFTVWGPDIDFLDVIQANGGKAWIELTDAWNVTTGAYNNGTLTSYVNATKTHPAVEGYTTVDEPDLNYFPVATFLTIYADIKALTALPVGSAIRYPWMSGTRPGLPYVPGCDILMPDPYVVPYSAGGLYAQQVGSETASSVAVSGGRPVYTVIQNFCWGNTFSPPTTVYPSVADMTTMGTAAREAGAPHLWIYAWHGDILQPALTFDQFNPSCYAALGNITEAWRAIGAPAGGTAPRGLMVRRRRT